MTDLADAARLGAASDGLVVVSIPRLRGSVHASVVNAGVLPHPVTGEQIVGFTTRRGTWKLRRLRESPQATVTFRSGWEWASVEGRAQLAGPDDPLAGVDAEGVRVLLRDVFTAAGGTHDDFDEYDRVMREERRAAVLVTPDRVYSNRPA